MSDQPKSPEPSTNNKPLREWLRLDKDAIDSELKNLPVYNLEILFRELHELTLKMLDHVADAKAYEKLSQEHDFDAQMNLMNGISKISSFLEEQIPLDRRRELIAENYKEREEK